MQTELYWIDGPWPGRLAIAARPRGGDWLEDEMQGWSRMGVNTVVSLLTADEEEDLDLAGERETAAARGMQFISLPRPDRQVPVSNSEVMSALQQIESDLSSGDSVVVHCRQGIGRSGLIACALLIAKRLDPTHAVQRISRARGAPVPETKEQRDWIDPYAATLTGTK